MSVIKTYDKTGHQTGELIPLWHIDQGPPIDQVYLTTIWPGRTKGPHLHLKRRGLFHCVFGEVRVVMRVGSTYCNVELLPGDPPIEVPPGTPALLFNPSGCISAVLNMPSPPWRVGEEDEHEVTDWTWKP